MSWVFKNTQKATIKEKQEFFIWEKLILATNELYAFKT